MSTDRSNTLAPLRTRLLVFLLLAGLAVAAIWLIDRRAMMRMQEYRQEQQQQVQPQMPQAQQTPLSFRGASEGPDFLPVSAKSATSRVASY